METGSLEALILRNSDDSIYKEKKSGAKALEKDMYLKLFYAAIL